MSPDYTMRTPCSNCPFRREGGIRLHPGRVRELATHDGDFYCHKTAKGEHEGEEGDDYRATGEERMCADAADCHLPVPVPLPQANGHGEEYAAFLARKQLLVRPAGIDVAGDAIHPMLYPFQRDLVRWALRKGRCAIWADTGLGKTIMQVEWGRLTRERVLFLAPLAVARQTVMEARKLGVDLVYARRQADARHLTITNYEMVEHFDPDQFGAVVPDESGILKSFDGATRNLLIEMFARTPFRLCNTATPAPNDIAELANHAEFLGIMSRVDMLATFFVHDDAGWRLKGHARQPFFRWLASWGMSLKKPSDLGYSDDGFTLPPLAINPVIVGGGPARTDRLFSVGLKGIQDRADVRRSTLEARVQAAAELVRSEPGEPWLCWVGMNDEGRRLAELLPGAALVEGADSPDEKADTLERFVRGDVRILITKTRIAGFGMNFQNCARMLFCGLSDSYEQYYQAIRRCWRFGQLRPVDAYVVLSEPEEAIYHNVLRKEREAQMMGAELIQHVAEFERAEIAAARMRGHYSPGQEIRLPHWLNGGTTQ